MTCANHDYKIAVGANNVVGLTLITSITDGANFFIEPRALGTFNNGLAQAGSDGLLVFQGFPSLIWNMVMTTRQYVYWRTTYAGGGYSGSVTIRTTTERSDIYANYSAVMLIPQVSEADRVGDYYTVAIRMTRLEIIT